ncbi:Cadherin-like and PC-esterase domain-containing protein 1 [Nymphon striatum]|nr:Cadherin-like and PC-esterase domain-containing protein 1 [Nymphon striatum]
MCDPLHKNQSGVAKGEGKWYVPCKSCSDTHGSCLWSRSVWQPHRCKRIYLPRNTLSKCLENKKVLFIGDSTNRGMMYYVLERLNGTLSRWDKTHGISIINDINDGKTSFAFTYYPQFWLHTDRRPIFDKAVHQLLNSFGFDVRYLSMHTCQPTMFSKREIISSIPVNSQRPERGRLRERTIFKITVNVETLAFIDGHDITNDILRYSLIFHIIHGY